MWVSPESGWSWQQIADKVWRSLPPDVQTRCEAVMAARRWTFEQFCQETYERGHEQFVKDANDPNSALSQEFDRRDFPFGRDPWLERHP